MLRRLMDVDQYAKPIYSWQGHCTRLILPGRKGTTSAREEPSLEMAARQRLLRVARFSQHSCNTMKHAAFDAGADSV